MITSERDAWIGAHLFPTHKEALRVEANRRHVSMSALVSHIIEIWLDVAHKDDFSEGDIQKNPDGGTVRVITPIDGLKDVPLPFVEDQEIGVKMTLVGEFKK